MQGGMCLAPFSLIILNPGGRALSIELVGWSPSPFVHSNLDNMNEDAIMQQKKLVSTKSTYATISSITTPVFQGMED
jgi:hypothetical protein